MQEILFVHPDQRLTSLYHQKLKQHFKVHTAVDGLSAVRKIRAIAPQIVISEYHLPLLSGRQLAQFVRNHKPTATALFIFLTRSQFDHEALGLGVNDWISLDKASPDLIIQKTYQHLKLMRNQYV